MIVYTYRPFKPNISGHGGEKRAAQIEDLFRSINNELKPLELLDITNIGNRISRFFLHIFNYPLIKSLGLPYNSLKQYRIISNKLSIARKQIPKIDKESIIVYEHSVISNWLIPFLLNYQGNRLIIIPHNLETLVPFQHSKITGIYNPKGLFEELKLMSLANLILTISKEEEWLLNLFGKNALYFPYYPSESEIVKLKKIKESRKSRRFNRSFLIFGSAGNPPTYQGMMELLEFLINNNIEGGTFHIAGFGTNKMKKYFNFPDNFVFHGPVEIKELYQLYSKIDAVIIHQLPTSGALIKIPEFLIAGIPIIANQHAARNYFNMNGLVVYRDFNDLYIKLINSELLIEPYEYDCSHELSVVKQFIKNKVNIPFQTNT